MSDPHWEKVQLLLHMDGANGSTSIVDVKGHSVVAHNGPSISTAKSKFGGASCLSATNSYGSRLYATSPDFAITDEDFVHEFQFQPIDGGSSSWFTLLYVESIGGALEYSVVYRPQSRDIEIQTKYGSSNRYYPFGSLGEFTHLALVRYGSSIKLYCGGIERCSLSLGGGFSTSNTLNIAGLPTGFLGAYGYVDEYRFTKGEARYTNNFTPPDAPFPESGGATAIDTVLLGGLYPSATSALLVSNPTVNDGSLVGALSPYGALIVNNPEIIDGVISGELLPHSDSAIYIDNPGPNTADLFGKLSPSQTSVILVDNPQVAPAPGAMSVQVLGQILLFSQLINEARVDGVLDLQGGLWQEVTTAGVLELLGSIQASIGSYVLVSGELALTNGVEERSLERQPAIDETSGDIEFVAPTLGRY